MKKRRRPAARRRRRRRPPWSRLRRRQRLVTIAVLLATVTLWWWARRAPPPSDSSDACAIFQERPSWYRHSLTASRRWGVSETVVLAILEQESGLRAGARPPRRWFLRIIPGRRPSSAYGYAQVVDATWRQYEHAVGRDASRRRFADASDFVAWYVSRLRSTLDLSASQVAEIYLAYHEGPGGYARGSHLAKPSLRRRARLVEGRAARYASQLGGCRTAIERALLWRDVRRFLLAAVVTLSLGALAWRRLRR